MNKKALFLKLFFCLFIWLPLSALVKNENIIPMDQNLVLGQLENGLKYYILPNQLPEKKAFIRLVVDAGSVLEEEDQRGLAHFLEHMAFNGTRSYPKNELVDYLQTLGMEFGPEVNAYTSFDETVYKLAVPTEPFDGLTEGLKVLEEWAFHLNLTDEDIDAERPVIIEEWRSGRSAASRMQDEAFPILYKDSKYGSRLPIGTVESINNFDSSRLRDFYHDWYRPDLMSIIVVGDIDPALAEQHIKEMFSSYKTPEDAPPRAEPSVPDHQEDLFALQRDKETSYSSLEILKKMPARRVSSGLDYKGYVAEQLYLSLFNNRMAAFLREGEPAFIDGYASTRTSLRPLLQASMGVIAGPDKIRDAFYSYWKEVIRIQRFGFSEQEWDQARGELKSSYEYLYNQKDSLYSSDLVEMLQFSVIHKEPFPSIVWECEKVWSLLDSISQEEVMAMADQWFEPGNRVFFTMERADEEPLTAEELQTIMARVEAERILPREPERELGDLVSVIPAAGVLKEKFLPGEWEVPESLGITKLVYENGAVVYLMPTDFRESEVLFQAVSQGGMSMTETNNIIPALLSSTAVGQSGLGEFSISELERLLANNYVSLAPSIDQYEESISGFSTTADLEILLQLNYLYFTAPIYEANRWKAYETRLRPYLESKEDDPSEQYRRMMNKSLYDNNPRMQPLTSQRLDLMDYEKSFRFFKQRFLTGGDFDFMLVGNFDPEAVEPLLAQWVASLPPQEGKRETWQDTSIRFTQEDHKEELKLNSDPLSIVTLAYTGQMDWSIEETIYMRALTSALEDRLQEIIREEEGGTYTVSSFITIDEIPLGQYALYLQFTCNPERQEALTDRMIQEINNFSSSEDLSIYAQNTREAQKNTLQENRQKNQWWMNVLKFISSHDQQQIEDWMKQELFIENITAETLRAAAEKYLATAALQQWILSPQE